MILEIRPPGRDRYGTTSKSSTCRSCRYLNMELLSQRNAMIAQPEQATGRKCERFWTLPAVAHRIPADSVVRGFADEGGLMSYAPAEAEIYRRAAAIVDKILKGAKPSRLPVEQPTKFELLVNLKTAKALGLTISLSLLVRADVIIE
jgi:putative tryptophan/tyrosine transport system substrate-binding protein